MSNTKTPILSFGAQGSIGDAVTFQKRKGTTIARIKPVPDNPRSLDQMYQRWLYQDYIALWATLTLSEKRTWSSIGSRKHMTGFAAFMSFYLKTWDDIVGVWHLDNPAGAIAYDASPNQNNGIITGAFPYDGIIAGGRWWDGVNDIIRVPHHDSLNFGTDDFAIFAFINIPDLTTHRYIASKNIGVFGNWRLQITAAGALYTVCQDTTGAIATTDTANGFVPTGQDLAIVFTVNRNGVGRLFMNRQEVPYFRQQSFAGMVSFDSIADLYFGLAAWPTRTKGMKDEIRIYRRQLTDEQIILLSDRQYPL